MLNLGSVIGQQGMNCCTGLIDRADIQNLLNEELKRTK